MPFIIYCITNSKNGKQYVGQSIRPLKERWAQHVYEAMTGRSRCRSFAEAIREYGPEAFVHEVLASTPTRKEANDSEAKWITELNCLTPNGYNIRLGGSGLGEESRKILSEKARIRQAALTPEQRSENVRKGRASLTPKQRSEIARKGRASMTREELTLAAIRGKLAMTPEQRSNASRKASAGRTHEERSQSVRKGHAKRTHEQRRESALKMWATRRAKMAGELSG